MSSFHWILYWMLLRVLLPLLSGFQLRSKDGKRVRRWTGVLEVHRFPNWLVCWKFTGSTFTALSPAFRIGDCTGDWVPFMRDRLIECDRWKRWIIHQPWKHPINGRETEFQSIQSLPSCRHTLDADAAIQRRLVNAYLHIALGEEEKKTLAQIKILNESWKQN